MLRPLWSPFVRGTKRARPSVWAGVSPAPGNAEGAASDRSLGGREPALPALQGTCVIYPMLAGKTAVPRVWKF